MLREVHLPLFRTTTTAPIKTRANKRRALPLETSKPFDVDRYGCGCTHPGIIRTQEDEDNGFNLRNILLTPTDSRSIEERLNSYWAMFFDDEIRSYDRLRLFTIELTELLTTEEDRQLLLLKGISQHEYEKRWNAVKIGFYYLSKAYEEYTKR